MSHLARLFASFALAALCAVAPAAAQSLEVVGAVRDQTGDALPGALVELTTGAAPARRVQTDQRGAYRFDGVTAGRAVVSFSVINFGAVRRRTSTTRTAWPSRSSTPAVAARASGACSRRRRRPRARAPSSVHAAGLVSPKGGVVFGPWRGTELYVNGGFGFHSNDARRATIPADPVTGDPARGAEVGIRSVRIPHLQTSLAVWTLNLDSELIFIGDAGNTEAGRPSYRHGLELANYYSPRPWLTLDVDLSLSRARFTDVDPSGNVIPGAVSTVVQAGVTVDSVKNVFGSVRWRYFGPRALIEDDSVRSQATSLVNLEAGYRFTRSLRLAHGIEDLHLHPTLPRTARVSLRAGF